MTAICGMKRVDLFIHGYICVRSGATESYIYLRELHILKNDSLLLLQPLCGKIVRHKPNPTWGVRRYQRLLRNLLLSGMPGSCHGYRLLQRCRLL
jgi:hypothetical protein